LLQDVFPVIIDRQQEVMRAAQFVAPEQISVVNTASPIPGPHQVLVRLSGSGVCGSNLPVWLGRPWFSYPLAPGAPGHEGWGWIELCGSEIENLPCGQPVALLSQRAFAELDIAEASEVVPLEGAAYDQPLPAEAIACGVNVMKRAAIAPGDRVAIVGVGFLGAVLVRLASAAGACVTAISRRRFALDLAGSLGAVAEVPMVDVAQAAADARRSNGGADFDTVIEATGLPRPLDLASQITRIRGRLVIAGYHQDGPRQVDLQLWNWRGLDVINAHEREVRLYVEGMREAVHLVATGVLPLDRLVTHVFPLTRAADAFRSAVERPDGFLKAVVTSNED
jgi:2-desacetyl-2-hydroxyethyl bacteriochlorophyllide A dehydrogenase